MSRGGTLEVTWSPTGAQELSSERDEDVAEGVATIRGRLESGGDLYSSFGVAAPAIGQDIRTVDARKVRETRQEEEERQNYRQVGARFDRAVSVARRFRQQYEHLTQLQEEPVTRRAFSRAIKFLARCLSEVPVESATPYLADSYDGSVDIVWNSPRRTVIVNVPDDGLISFAAQDDVYSSRGDIRDYPIDCSLIAWLSKG